MDRFFYNKHKTKLWLASSIMIVIISVISDIGGAFQTLASVFSFMSNYKVSLMWILLILLLAALSFICVWRHQIKKDGSPNHVTIENRGQFYEKLQSSLINALYEVFVIGLEKDWVFQLISSIALARLKGIKIQVIYFRECHERYKLLEYLGCQVYSIPTVDEPSLLGILIDPVDILHSKAAIHVPRKTEKVYGRYYYGSVDLYAISAFHKLAIELIGGQDSEEPSSDFIPELVEVSEQSLIEKLKNVKFYHRANITLEEVDVHRTKPTADSVARYKINQVTDLISVYKQKGWVLFRPTAFKLKNNAVSLLVPPVLEEHKGELLVAEGHSRLYCLRQQNVQKAQVVVVRGVTKPLPLKYTTWNKVTVVDERIREGNIELARYVETSTHRGVWGSAN